MTETVQTACQIIILNGIIVTLSVRVVFYIYGLFLTGILHIYGVMDINSGDIIQNRTVLILNLAGSVSITAVILIRITVNYDLRCGCYNRSSLLYRSGRFSL